MWYWPHRKGTVNVFLSDPTLKEGNAPFTAVVAFKPSFEQILITLKDLRIYAYAVDAQNEINTINII